MSTRVAVIGLGPVGLMALKNLLEDGFDVTAFEKRSYVGGLWKQSYDSSLSITTHTVFNSSRFVSAISDFPFADHHDDFPSASQLWEYLNLYTDHFNLRPHIQLSTEVVRLRRVDQKWELTTRSNGSEPKTQFFDKVVTATGSFVTPITPTIDGIERFHGEKLHAINFPDPSVFKGQNVLIVGLHATTQDIVVELSEHASKIWMAHRTGVHFLSRYSDDGRTFDQALSLNFLLKILLFMSTHFPTLWYWLFDSIIIKMSKKAWPNQKKEWGLSNSPSLAVTTPMIVDDMYPHLESGLATPVAAIQCVTGPREVILTDGKVLKDIDSIIYCTGYDFDVPPFVPKEYHPYPQPGMNPYLYRNIFPLDPDPAIRNSLAFLGQAGFPFPGFCQFEMYTMAVSQIWQGKHKLPPLKEMEKWYNDHTATRKRIAKQYGRFSYSVFINIEDIFPWLDEVVGTGLIAHTSWFSWKAWQFWWSDRKFYNMMTNGLLSPAIWRLFDMGGRKPWAGAREQIIRDNEFAKMRAEKRRVILKAEKEKKTR